MLNNWQNCHTFIRPFQVSCKTKTRKASPKYPSSTGRLQPTYRLALTRMRITPTISSFGWNNKNPDCRVAKGRDSSTTLVKPMLSRGSSVKHNRALSALCRFNCWLKMSRRSKISRNHLRGAARDYPARNYIINFCRNIIWMIIDLYKEFNISPRISSHWIWYLR